MATDPNIGRFVGNYVVEDKLGAGASATVYRARHRHIARTVAVKILHAHLHHAPEVVARFEAEAQAVSAVRHPHIVELLDFGTTDDGTLYLAMEWLAGRSLADELTQSGPLSIARMRHIVRGIGSALALAHARGIVHRDLKPENIFLVEHDGDPDFVKVLDFGIAKLLHPEAGRALTHAGEIWGTPEYMSPEQCRGATDEIDTRSDIYSLGVIIHELLSGQLPFGATNAGELLIAHAMLPPPSLRSIRSINPAMPTAIADAVLRALHKDRARRFASVEELVAALHQDSPPRSRRRWPRYWPLADLACGAAIVVAAWRSPPPHPVPRPPAAPVARTVAPAPIVNAPAVSSITTPAVTPLKRSSPRARASELITQYPQ